MEDNVVVLKKERDAINDEFKMEIDKRTVEMKTRMQEIETEKAKLTEKIEYLSKINRQFLVVNNLFKSNEANMPEISSSNISSVGHGENNPVANNETRKGRRMNRRIDVIIKSGVSIFKN